MTNVEFTKAVQTAMASENFLFKQPDGIWDVETQRAWGPFSAKYGATNAMQSMQPHSAAWLPEALKSMIKHATGAVESAADDAVQAAEKLAAPIAEAVAKHEPAPIVQAAEPAVIEAAADADEPDADEPEEADDSTSLDEEDEEDEEDTK